jgi:hypothetical protein
MIDLPVLNLEQYYNFVNIYNRYYSCAIELTKDKHELKKDDDDFLESFEAFRSAYAELETVLYVDLSYYLGLIVKANLSPLPVEFPRVTRILLKKCIDYGVLDAKKYPGNFKYPPLRDLSKYARDRTLIDKYYLRRKIESREDFAEKYWEKPGESPSHIAKERIDRWNMSAAGLEDVYDEIYHRDKIPVFNREVRKDFVDRIIALERTAEKLKPLCRECLEKEKEKESLKETETIKGLFEELDALEKLLKAKDITNDEYEKMKASLQKKLKHADP